MSHDPTEDARRHMLAVGQQQTAAVMEAVGNDKDAFRAALELEHGKVWTTAEAQEEFTFLGFMAPIVVVLRKSDNKKGSLFFTGSPRLYYGFEEDK